MSVHTDYAHFNRVHSQPPHPEAAALGMTDAAVQAAGGIELVKARLASAEAAVVHVVEEVKQDVQHVVEEVTQETEHLLHEGEQDAETVASKVTTEAETVEHEVEADVALAELKMPVLWEMAKELGIEVEGHIKKVDLVALIEEAQAALNEAATGEV